MQSLKQIWTDGQAAMPELVEQKIAELRAQADAGKMSPKAAERIIGYMREEVAEAKAPSAPANQNTPAGDTPPQNSEKDDLHRARLEAIQMEHGGELKFAGGLWVLWGATIGDVTGQVSIDRRGKVWIVTPTGKISVDDSPPPPPLPLINPADWHGKPIPPRDWYADGMVPARQVTIVSGDGGTGKSLLFLQIGACGAMGIETLGLELAAGPVLYLGAEDEEGEFHRRLADIVAGHDRTLADLSDFRLLPMAGEDAMLSVPGANGLMVPTHLWDRFSDAAREFQPRLIVLDTVADLFGGDEIKRVQARQFISMLRKLAIEIDCAVVLLAHPSQHGMTSGSGRSGSTGWSNSSRGMLYLTRPEGADEDPDIRLLSTKKVNYGRVGGEIKLRWKEGCFVLDDGKPTMGATLLQGKAERVFREVLSDINRHGDRVAKTKGLNYAPRIVAERPEAEGLSVKVLETAMFALLASGDVKVVMEGPPSKRRQRLILASEGFGPE